MSLNHAFILDQVRRRAGERAAVLDFGCGQGEFVALARREGLDAQGCDWYAGPWAWLFDDVKNNPALRDHVKQIAPDGRLPFSDARFDAVTSNMVFEHVVDFEKPIGEIARVLKPGGKFVLAENNARSLEVVFLERLVNVAKRALGRVPHERRRVPLGIEEWQVAGSDGLMVRKTDMPALVRHCSGLGLELKKRFAGQFTEAYVRVPTRLAKRAIHAFNRFYFSRVGRPGPALSNVLVFRKRRTPS